MDGIEIERSERIKAAQNYSEIRERLLKESKEKGVDSAEAQDAGEEKEEDLLTSLESLGNKKDKDELLRILLFLFGYVMEVNSTL